MAKGRMVETEVEERVRTVESRLEADIEDLIIIYNANVLKHRNLALLENYLVHLHNAWGRLVEDEKAVHPDESIDEFELENRMLNEDERKILHESIILHEKEKLGIQHSEVGEGSCVEHTKQVLRFLR